MLDLNWTQSSLVSSSDLRLNLRIKHLLFYINDDSILEIQVVSLPLVCSERGYPK